MTRFRANDTVIININEDLLCKTYGLWSLKEYINGEIATVIDPDKPFYGMHAVFVRVESLGFKLYLSEEMLLPIYSSHQEKLLQVAMRDDV